VKKAEKTKLQKVFLHSSPLWPLREVLPFALFVQVRNRTLAAHFCLEVPLAREPVVQPAEGDLWPTKGWATASPGSVELDEQVLLGLDKDMASGGIFADDGQLCSLPVCQEGS
jgi:hypothetical protein